MERNDLYKMGRLKEGWGGPLALEGFRGCDVKGDRLTTTKNNFEIGSATFMTT